MKKLSDSEEVTETTAQISERIIRVLSRTDHHFTLCFALVNLTEQRKIITANLIPLIKPPVIELTLSQDALEENTLDHWLQQQLKNQPQYAAVFLYNLGDILPNTKQALRKYLQQLNWRRSALAAIKRPLVIWLPRHAIDHLAEYAPDFYDWYSHVYEFPTDEKQLAEQNKHFQAEFSTDIQPANRMSHKEKKQWLQTLTHLVDENKEKNKYRVNLLNNVGLLHHSLGNNDDALAYYLQSLAIHQEIGDKSDEGTSLNNISQIYDARGDYETALEYLKQSLVIQEEIGDKSGEGTSLNNISSIYYARGDNETALKYLKQSLAIREDIGDKSGEGTTLNNISQIYYARGDYETALKYLKQSLAIRQDIGDQSGLCASLFNIGHIYLHNKQREKAIETWLTVYKIAEPMKLEEILEALESLANQLGLEGGLEAWKRLAEKAENDGDSNP